MDALDTGAGLVTWLSAAGAGSCVITGAAVGAKVGFGVAANVGAGSTTASTTGAVLGVDSGAAVAFVLSFICFDICFAAVTFPAAITDECFCWLGLASGCEVGAGVVLGATTSSITLLF